ncbi:MAG: hypothetical protein ACRCT1_22175 [Microcoleaceae cyanobacterium]
MERLLESSRFSEETRFLASPAIASLWRSETGFLSETSRLVEVYGRNPVSQKARSRLGGLKKPSPEINFGSR